MNIPDLGIHVVHVRDGPTKVLGGILASSRVCLQQQLLKCLKDGAFLVSLWATVSDALELGSAGG